MPEAPKLDEFESLVVDAIDRLPEEFQEVLARVAVVVSDLGAEAHAYGEYSGDGVAHERYADRIVIYRDTLERDFGHDRDLLARQASAPCVMSLLTTSAGMSAGWEASASDRLCFLTGACGEHILGPWSPLALSR